MPDPVLVTLGDTEMNRCGCALELFLVQLGHRQENMIKTVWGKGCKGTKKDRGDFIHANTHRNKNERKHTKTFIMVICVSIFYFSFLVFYNKYVACMI